MRVILINRYESFQRKEKEKREKKERDKWDKIFRKRLWLEILRSSSTTFMFVTLDVLQRVSRAFS